MEEERNWKKIAEKLDKNLKGEKGTESLKDKEE